MRRPSIVMPVSVLVGVVATTVVAIKAVLRLPGIPYNFRELFLGGARVPALVWFTLTLIWIGAGPMLLAHAVMWRRRSYVVVPVGLILTSLVSKMLLSASVTYESIDDVIGSNNVFVLVTRENAWGASWQRTFESIGPNLVDYLERRIRYTALYSLPLLAIALVLILMARASLAAHRLKPLETFVLVGCAAVWLWLARTVVISWAATDNLTELIARHSALGIGGEWYLFALPLVIGLAVAQLMRATEQPSWWPYALAISLAALPIGWWLLKLGLEGSVEKYGLVFSGAQFLLGPDRRNTLPDRILFMRWIVVEAGAIAVTFAGAWIAHRLLAAAYGTQATLRYSPGDRATA